MIFFHGGSFEEGGSSLFFYNATNLAVSQCVVVVTGNYRLGAFGSLFLPVSALPSVRVTLQSSQKSCVLHHCILLASISFTLPQGLDGNQNLRDQRAMMQWLHNNAVALGVDASRVTIFGQSAGAMSVQFHLTSPLSRPLFSRAIMESSFGAMVYKSRKQALQFGSFFSDQMGCGDSPVDALACMRNATSDAVKAAWVGLGGNASKIADMVFDWRNLAVALTFTPAVLETDEWSAAPLSPSFYTTSTLYFTTHLLSPSSAGLCSLAKPPLKAVSPTCP
jgi:carboxylesterase type B